MVRLTGVTIEINLGNARKNGRCSLISRIFTFSKIRCCIIFTCTLLLSRALRRATKWAGFSLWNVLHHFKLLWTRKNWAIKSKRGNYLLQPVRDVLVHGLLSTAPVAWVFLSGDKTKMSLTITKMLIANFYTLLNWHNMRTGPTSVLRCGKHLSLGFRWPMFELETTPSDSLSAEKDFDIFYWLENLNDTFNIFVLYNIIS